MPQNTESFPGKGMYRAGQCESVCEWMWACVSMNGVQDGAEASWPMNSIRLIIFTVRVRAAASGWTRVPRVADRCWQAAAVGRHRLTRCATGLLQEPVNRSLGRCSTCRFPLSTVSSYGTLPSSYRRSAAPDSTVLPDSSLPWRASPALLFVFRVHLFFYI